jgi:hypothetical protein
MTRRIGTQCIVLLVVMLVILFAAWVHGDAAASGDVNNQRPSIEDYATIEGYCHGLPIYSFGNITYVYSVSPDLLPGVVMQQANAHPIVKIKPKKSWEIGYNLCGAEPGEMANRTMWNDDQPMLPIHLIDGDPNTYWSSFGGMTPDARPEWIRIDLPAVSTISSVALVTAAKSATTSGQFGRTLPKQLSIKVSKDAWHWDTVYESKDFSGPEPGTSLLGFKPVAVKQVMIVANNLRRMEEPWSLGYVFSVAKVEVRDPQGNNLALVSRGAGVTVSSVGRLLAHDRFTHDILFTLPSTVTSGSSGSAWAATTGCSLGTTWSVKKETYRLIARRMIPSRSFTATA